MHRVVQRINALTGTAYNNGEDLQARLRAQFFFRAILRAQVADGPTLPTRPQVVRYEPGQFYKQHHDQNTALWTPQGPRVLTFFMYLNEVDGGGETAFPQVGPGGTIVQPKKRSAVLWPSLYDERPMEADHRTTHEARPVTSGIKYGANMWIHQFDFKTPSERGCKLTYVNTAGRVPDTREHHALVHGYVPTAEETIAGAARSARR